MYVLQRHDYTMYVLQRHDYTMYVLQRHDYKSIVEDMIIQCMYYRLYNVCIVET